MKLVICFILLAFNLSVFADSYNQNSSENECANYPSDEYPLVKFCENDSQILIEHNGKFIFKQKNQFKAKLKYLLNQWIKKNPVEKSKEAIKVKFGIFVPELAPERSQLIVLYLLKDYSLMLNFDASKPMPVKLNQLEIKLADEPDIINSNKYFPGKVKVKFNKDISLSDLSECLKTSRATGMHWRIYDQSVWDVLVPVGQEQGIQATLNQSKQCNGKNFVEYADLDYVSTPMGLSFSFTQIEL